MKNYYLLSIYLLAIMFVATVVVIGFNFYVGLNTDVSDDDVATTIAIVAFGIALALRFVYYKE